VYPELALLAELLTRIPVLIFKTAGPPQGALVTDVGSKVTWLE